MSPHDVDRLRLRLIAQICRMDDERLRLLDEAVSRCQQPAVSPPPLPARDWPHAPLHRLSETGTYIVTASTAQKEHYFRGAERLDLLEAKLLSAAIKFGWQLEAWAVFSNHYHFVGHSPADPESLIHFLKELHGSTSHDVNELDGLSGRNVWFNYWETRLTYQTSYFARLSYVHNNAVKHGLVRVANQYRWCSAAWFERTATRAQVQTIYSMKTDSVKVRDDYDPV